MEKITTFVDPRYQRVPFWTTIKTLNFILATAALIFFFIFNSFYHTQMLNASAQFLVNFEQKYPGYKYWAWIWTNLAYSVAIVGCYFFLFFFRRKADALIFFFLFFFEAGTTEVLKLIMRDTRPCLQLESIAQLSCSCSFGMPSGHSSNTMLFYLLLAVLFFEDFHKGYVINAIFILAMVFIIVNVGISRLFYGAHSYNQVIMGYLIGYFFFSIYWLLSTKIRIIVAHSIAKSSEYRNLRILFFGLLFLGFLTLNGIGWGFWSRNVNGFEKLPDHPLVSTSCASKCFSNGKWMSDEHISSLAMINSAMFLSLLFAFYSGPKTVSSEHHYSLAWQGGCLVTFKRLLVFAIVTSPIWISFLLSRFFSGWKQYLVFTIGGLLFVILFVFVYKHLSRIMGVETAGDFFSNVPGPITREVEMANADNNDGGDEVLLTDKEGKNEFK